MSRNPDWKHAAAAGLMLAAAGAAEAHGQHGAADLAAGLAHPFSGLDHALAMLSVGLWSALVLPAGQRWRAPALFVALMALGAALAAAGLPMPGSLELLIAGSVVLLGALLVGGPQVAPVAGWTLVGTAALLHGAAHGLEMVPGASPGLYGLGFVVATALLHTLGLAGGRGMADGMLRLRALLGATVGAAGLLMLVGRL
jgi:urease accessory protein